MSSSADNFDDLNELIDEDDIIDGGTDAELFQQATTYVQSAAGTLDNTLLLKLYGYYKQAIDGPCSSDTRPSWYDFRAKSKYEAWYALGSMPKVDAQAKYVEVVQSLGHDLTANARHKPSTEAAGNNALSSSSSVNNTGSWVTHSTLQQYAVNDDVENETVDPHMKTLLDLISSNDLPTVKQHLSKHPELITRTSGHGHLTPTHYAADRGSACVLEHLLQYSINADDTKRQRIIDAVNVKDDDGQTPLHYASACGHTDCCKILLQYGANVELRDNDGQSCLDVAADHEITQLLLNSKT